MAAQLTQQEKRTRNAFHVFFIFVSLAAGGMFTFKLFSFLKTIKKDELAGFAFDPIMVYAFVAVGFLCLLAWAYLTGQFRDIERPKYELFEKFDEQERQEAALAKGRKA
ncbi:MAG: hypothetical protein H6828_10950 [Planctomycetes bacterium]|nr:hypothetical protein [Planctomycetota bacterium]